MIARQEVICRKACAVPLATCFAASASNAATKGLTAALLSFSQIPGLLVWVSATYRRPNSFCIASLSSKSLPAAYSSGIAQDCSLILPSFVCSSLAWFFLFKPTAGEGTLFNHSTDGGFADDCVCGSL